MRLQRIATARMGWGYLINNSNANFLLLVRHPSLLYTVGSNLNLLEIPESWNMAQPSNVQQLILQIMIKERNEKKVL